MATIIADLHTHTTCSDGALAPDVLVNKAFERGIEVLAVTDHDTIAGIIPAMEAGAKVGMMIVPGVELSISFLGRELHLLAYHFDPKHAGITHYLTQYQSLREARARAIVDRLQGLGVQLEYSDVQQYVGGQAVGRPHIAQALVAGGHVKSMEGAFIQFIGNRGPAVVPKKLPAAQEAIDMVHAAGGIAVLAHPGHWVSDRDLARLQAVGLDGVEINHPSHDETLTTFYQDVAHGLGLLTTGGSDFHGMRAGDEKNLGAIGMTRLQFDQFSVKCAA